MDNIERQKRSEHYGALYKLENIEYVNVVALGVDIWAAERVLSLLDAGRAVRLICASPYDGFERS